MKKADFVSACQKTAGDHGVELTKKTVGDSLDAILTTIADVLAGGEEVSFVGFGSFKTKKIAAKIGRNPKTGAALKIAAKTRVSFKPGKELKEAVN